MHDDSSSMGSCKLSARLKQLYYRLAKHDEKAFLVGEFDVILMIV